MSEFNVVENKQHTDVINAQLQHVFSVDPLSGQIDYRTDEEKKLASRSQFLGRTIELPENSGRPQKSDIRTFPLKQNCETFFQPDTGEGGAYEEQLRVPFNAVSTLLPHLRRNDSAPVFLRTATKLIRKPVDGFVSNATINAAKEHSSAGSSEASGCSPSHVSSERITTVSPFPINGADTTSDVDKHSGAQSPLMNSRKRSFVNPLFTKQQNVAVPNFLTKALVQPKILRKAASSGTLSRNGMSWRRKRSNERSEEQQEVTVQKRINRRLLRINNQLFTDDSRECYEFAAKKKCTAGIFCPFIHNGSDSHQTTKICARFMLGQCRSEYCEYSHALAEHQLPVCDYYLRCVCSNSSCSFLHVKHSDRLRFCEDFNRGTCKRGAECNAPHRYLPRILTKRGVPEDYVFSYTSDKVPHGPTSKLNEEIEKEVHNDSSLFDWIT
ncbi:hypothetical protein AB6A40_005480 [Gnathostoma spinigerum]|uniref:C3H1-type domain-containing protein n=1 Tax=Gnathostoma spinigerum TaxID=75299 RepID=A0ABD6EGE1_9BILA